MATENLAFEGELDELVLESMTTKLEAVAAGTALIVDFTDVTFCGSPCIRALIATRTRLVESGGSLVVQGLQPKVRHAFDLAEVSFLLG